MAGLVGEFLGITIVTGTVIRGVNECITEAYSRVQAWRNRTGFQNEVATYASSLLCVEDSDVTLHSSSSTHSNLWCRYMEHVKDMLIGVKRQMQEADENDTEVSNHPDPLVKALSKLLKKVTELGKKHDERRKKYIGRSVFFAPLKAKAEAVCHLPLSFSVICLMHTHNNRIMWWSGVLHA